MARNLTKICECGNKFIPKRGWQKYCSIRCQHRVVTRNYRRRSHCFTKRYHQDPDFRRNLLERNKEYRKKNKTWIIKNCLICGRFLPNEHHKFCNRKEMFEYFDKTKSLEYLVRGHRKYIRKGEII